MYLGWTVTSSFFRCNAESGSDPNNVVIASVGKFTASSDDNTNYPDYWTIRTPDFMAFRFKRKPAMWARATVFVSDTEDGLSTDVSAWKTVCTMPMAMIDNDFIWAATWQKQQNGKCTRRILRSAWASAQSDQSLRCPHEETLGP